MSSKAFELLRQDLMGATPPGLESAAAPSASRAEYDAAALSITVRFDDVSSRLGTINPTAQPFRVEDRLGVVPVSAPIAFPGSDTIVLELGRAVELPAQVHGAYGADPDTMPMDMERVVPALGFYGLGVDAAAGSPKL